MIFFSKNTCFICYYWGDSYPLMVPLVLDTNLKLYTFNLLWNSLDSKFRHGGEQLWWEPWYSCVARGALLNDMVPSYSSAAQVLLCVDAVNKELSPEVLCRSNISRYTVLSKCSSYFRYEFVVFLFMQGASSTIQWRPEIRTSHTIALFWYNILKKVFWTNGVLDSILSH